jgi:superfamily I DNA/RNA helicase
MPYYFNLPLVTELTQDQQMAVDEPNPLALSGGPGTGKSVVCLWRHIRNHSTGTSNSLLLTYTKTLEHYLRASARTQDEDAAQNIDRVYWWLTHNATDYDEIIVDEGQDIKKVKFQRFLHYTEKLTFGADERQSMYLSNEDLRELLGWFSTDEHFSRNVEISLNRNFRNSKEILQFTRTVFPDFLIPHNTIIGAKQTGLKPIMKLNLGWGAENQVDDIVGIINDFNSDTHNIAILVPFASKVNTYHNLLKDALDDNIELTKFQNEMDEFAGLAGVHITTFHSSKGTEFDTVIIPEFDRFSQLIANFDVITESSYYVAFTRARTNLFLLCNNGFPNIGSRKTVTIE